MAVGGRFDLEEARREALEAKRRAKIRSIVSNATLVAVLLAVAVGGKIGWDWWSEKREAERVAAEQARIAEERNVALYCGEYGVINKAEPEDTLRWYADINAAFEQYGIGRASWSYRAVDFGLADEHMASVIDRLVKYL